MDIDPNESFLEVFEQIQSYVMDTNGVLESENEEVNVSYNIGIPGIFAMSPWCSMMRFLTLSHKPIFFKSFTRL